MLHDTYIGMSVYSCIHIFDELLLKIPFSNASDHGFIGSSEAEINVFFFTHRSDAYRSCIKTCKSGMDSVSISI